MATTSKVALTIQTSGNMGPSVALVTPSKTQIPTHIVQSQCVTAGEEPLYLVHMTDGTYVYIKESLLSQSGGTARF